MKNNKKILAIIPARGGSKGIPGKNIKLLCGKPLIVYTIEAALRSKYLDRIIVSTDDEEISRISKKSGAEVIERPAELAQDNTPTYPLVEHVTKHFKKTEQYNPDAVILLQPTSPLRTTDDIDRAIELFLSNKCESVISVFEVGQTVYISLKMVGKFLQPIFSKKFFIQGQRQILPKAYITNGAIFISSLSNLHRYKNFYNKKVLPYIMPLEKSVNIDHKVDFDLAELLIKKNNA